MSMGRLKKLLDTASHPNTGEHERLNAITAFKRIAEKSGALMDADHRDNYWHQRYTEEKAKSCEYVLEANRLRPERDDALRKLGELRATLRGLVSDVDAHDPIEALHGALQARWRTITDIERVAVRNGFTGSQGTLRNRADRLAKAGVIEVREAGEYANEYGVRSWHGRSWRLKP